MQQESRHFTSIQALRFIAAAMVVVFHGSHYADGRLTPGPIVINGAAGVDIFFVISGFVMMISSRDLFKADDGWRRFSLRRVARIVPLYWALLSVKVLTLLLMPGALANTEISVAEILCAYLFLPHYNADGDIFPILVVGWTLNFEMFFYAILALGMYWRLPPYRFCLGVLTVLSLGALLRPPDGPAALFYLDPIILEFGLGMLIARFVDQRPKFGPWANLILIVVGVLLLCIPMSAPPDLLRPIVWGLPAAAIVLGFCGLDREIAGITPRWVTTLGDASFALYLIHPIIGPFAPSLLRRFGLVSSTASIALTLLISVIAALALYRGFERPVTRFLNDLLSGRRVLNVAS
ncbi:MAG: acyltransferase [Burkholderiaceae bacterium]